MLMLEDMRCPCAVKTDLEMTHTDLLFIIHSVNLHDP